MCMVLHVRAPDQPAVTKARIRVDPRSRAGQARKGANLVLGRARQGLESVGRLMGRGGGWGRNMQPRNNKQHGNPFPFPGREKLELLGVWASCPVECPVVVVVVVS